MTGTFATTTTVRFRCREPGADSWIDFVAAEVAAATLNGEPLDVSGYREEDGIALPGLAADNELRVVATGRYMNTGEGLHRFVDPVDGGVYLYSQFETADAKRMFACFDQPDLKAGYTLTVTAPARLEGHLQRGGRGRPRTARRRGVHRFATTEIMSTYLVALVAGPYAEWRDEYPTTTAPSRWASTAAPRWPSTWTPSGCSPRPSRASTSTTATSACGTRSASTTSCSCRSSTRARWRTPAR